jgi:hypothetical protein
MKKVTELLPDKTQIEFLQSDWDYALSSGFGESKVLKISKA